jgi:glycosyltransferase involved in cell wall biosynthesis
VTVIIPSRDRTWQLARAVLSAVAQEDVSFEVIVVDDGSAVPVRERVDLTAMDAVTVIRLATSRGPAEARNAGLKAASGSWVAFLDDDDVWAPFKLRAQLQAVSGGCDLAFSSCLVVDDRGGVSVDPVTVSPRDLRRVALARNPVPGGCSNVLARTSLVRSRGGFDQATDVLEDWDLIIRLSCDGRPCVIQEPLIAYSLHSANLHAREVAAANSFRRLAEKYVADREELGVALDLEWWWLWRLEAAIRGSNRRGMAKAYWELGRLRRDPTLFVRSAVAKAGGRRLIAELGHLRRPHAAAAIVPPRWLEAALHPAENRVRALTVDAGHL